MWFHLPMRKTISIHALREEGDPGRFGCRHQRAYFYPRPPRGGRPAGAEPKRVQRKISIHALREEGDLRPAPQPAYRSHFYPRPPRGGRHDGRNLCLRRAEFLSTPSARRATWGCHNKNSRGRFLSTPSARRATAVIDVPHKKVLDFYPRPPRGGRPGMTEKQRAEFIFLSTPSARRATMYSARAPRTSRHFYPRPPRGGRPRRRKSLTRVVKFLSTPSARRATARH